MIAFLNFPMNFWTLAVRLNLEIENPIEQKKKTENISTTLQQNKRKKLVYNFDWLFSYIFGPKP